MTFGDAHLLQGYSEVLRHELEHSAVREIALGFLANRYLEALAGQSTDAFVLGPRLDLDCDVHDVS